MKQALKTIEALVLNSKYQLVILFSATALFLSSCQKESIQSISQSPDQLISSQKQNHQITCVPFKATFITADVITSLDFPIQKDHITGTGEGTHIGKATIEAFIVSDLNTPFVNGTETITAANGDKISANTTGVVNSIDEHYIHATVTATIDGKLSTGRFAGATGSLTGLVTQSLDSPAGSVSIEGTICY